MTYGELAKAAARAAGFTGQVQFVSLPRAVEVTGADSEIYTMDYVMDTSKAAHLLGWKPRHSSFIDPVKTYFESWKAWQPKEAKPEEPAPQQREPVALKV